MRAVTDLVEGKSFFSPVVAQLMLDDYARHLAERGVLDRYEELTKQAADGRVAPIRRLLVRQTDENRHEGRGEQRRVVRRGRDLGRQVLQRHAQAGAQVVVVGRRAEQEQIEQAQPGPSRRVGRAGEGELEARADAGNGLVVARSSARPVDRPTRFDFDFER